MLALLAGAVIFGILFFKGVGLAATSVTLEWDDPNPPGDVDKFKVFVRQEGGSYDYNDPAWQGSAQTCTISNLLDDVDYYFVARAVDAAGNHSENSNEASYAYNRAPVLDFIGPKGVNEGETLDFTVSATDPDGNNMVFSAAPLPTGASFNPDTRRFVWTPDFLDAGQYTVTFKVEDDGEPPRSDTEDVLITVGDVDNVPPEAPQNLRRIDSYVE